MYKHIVPLERQRGVSHDEFVDNWRTQYATVVSQLDGAVRYRQVLPTEPKHAEFDGLAELYFETLESLYGALDSLGVRDGGSMTAVATETREELAPFPATAVQPRFIGEEIVQKDAVDGDTDGLYKYSSFLVRQADRTHEEFVAYWQNNHTSIVRQIDGVVRYHTIIPADSEEAAFDGVTELYFDSLSKLYAAFGSEGVRDYSPEGEKATEVRENLDRFLAIDDRPRLIGREHVIADQT